MEETFFRPALVDEIPFHGKLHSTWFLMVLACVGSLPIWSSALQALVQKKKQPVLVDKHAIMFHLDWANP